MSVNSSHSVLENPKGRRGNHQPLYTVRFNLSETSTYQDQDSIAVALHKES
jgi:hypothetical protein